MNIIILGSPGSGKGTQAKLLAEKLNLKTISSGQLLRQIVKGTDEKSKKIKTLMNKGELPPFNSFAEELFKEIKNSPQGFILDGTPRNKAQAEYLHWYLKKNKIPIHHVVVIELKDDTAIQRMLKRAKKENRSDDTPETIKHRFTVYHKQTEPIIDFYRQHHNLVEIDGEPDIETIHKDILSKISSQS